MSDRTDWLRNLSTEELLFVHKVYEIINQSTCWTIESQRAAGEIRQEVVRGGQLVGLNNESKSRFESEILRFAILATDTYASDMGPTYFEVMFSKSGSPQCEYWRVCIELDDDDRALLKSNRSAELRTRAVVRRSGILDLLPAVLEDFWERFGAVLEENVIGAWHGGSDPIIAKNGHKVWIIPRVQKQRGAGGR